MARGKRATRSTTVHGQAVVEWYTGYVREGRFVPVTRWQDGEADAVRAARRARESGHPAQHVACRVVYPWQVADD